MTRRLDELLLAYDTLFTGFEPPPKPLALDENARAFADRAFRYHQRLPRLGKTPTREMYEEAALWHLHSYLSNPVRPTRSNPKIHNETRNNITALLGLAHRDAIALQAENMVEALKRAWIVLQIRNLRNAIRQHEENPQEHRSPEQYARWLYNKTPFAKLRDQIITDMALFQSDGKYVPGAVEETTYAHHAK